MTSLIITVLAGLLVIGFGICLLCGIGTGFISGVNNLSNFDKAKLDRKKLGRAVGLFAIICGVFLTVIDVIRYLNPQYSFVMRIIEMSYIILAVAILAIVQTKNNGFVKKD